MSIDNGLIAFVVACVAGLVAAYWHRPPRPTAEAEAEYLRTLWQRMSRVCRDQQATIEQLRAEIRKWEATAR